MSALVEIVARGSETDLLDKVRATIGNDAKVADATNLARALNSGGWVVLYLYRDGRAALREPPGPHRYAPMQDPVAVLLNEAEAYFVSAASAARLDRFMYGTFHDRGGEHAAWIAPRCVADLLADPPARDDPDARFARPYADWGKCELCDVSVPPSGARIGFFGKVDTFPRWCRECVVPGGDPELLAAWDSAVKSEGHRRSALGAKHGG